MNIANINPKSTSITDMNANVPQVASMWEELK